MIDLEEQKRRAAEYHRKWYIANQEKQQEYSSKYNVVNKEKRAAHRRTKLQESASYQREWGSKNPDKKAAYWRKFNYNLTIDDYQKLLMLSQGRCPICFRPFDFNKKEPCVDHDHVDGTVRGLLCNRCNRHLGGLNDDLETLQRAVKYLQRT